MIAARLAAPPPSAPRPEVSVFVPALNERDNIAPVSEKIAEGCEAAGASFEIVFVDDGSSDGTSDVMVGIADRGWQVQVLRHRKARGITQGMVTAFRCVRGDIIIWIPADLESDPAEDIPKLLAKMKADDLDVVCGWRQGRGDGKVFASWVYNRVSSLLFPVDVHDLNWIKAWRRECLYGLHMRGDWHRFLVHIWAERGFSVGEVKTQWHRRSYGRSKFGLRRIVGSFFDVVALRFLLTFSRKPLSFFGTAGGLVVVLGVALLGFLTWLYFVHDTQQRPLFIFGLNMVLMGFLLVCVGFLAELNVKAESAAPPVVDDDLLVDSERRRVGEADPVTRG